MEDAGHAPGRFEGAVGVFGGCGPQAYFARHLLPNVVPILIVLGTLAVAWIVSQVSPAWGRATQVVPVQVA